MDKQLVLYQEDDEVDKMNSDFANAKLEEIFDQTDPPSIQNVVATVNLGTELDLTKISHNARFAEYNPKRFAAVIMRLRDPKTTALVFQSGKMVCTGAKSEEASYEATRKYAKIIQKLGFPVQFKDFVIQNMVASFDFKKPIKLDEFTKNELHKQYVQYEPEIFPGLIYRKYQQQKKITLLIFVSGKVVITGAKNVEDLNSTFRYIVPFLEQFKKQNIEFGLYFNK